MKYETDEKCGQCGGNLIFDHTDQGGTIVKFSGGYQEIIRNAKMPFVWVYFDCEDCDYGLCCSSDSDSIKNTENSTKSLPVSRIEALRKIPKTLRKLVCG